MSAHNHDHILKLLLVGDTGCGKTCLLMSFVNDESEHDPDTRSTIGVDLKIKTVHCRGKKIKLTIWDTAGQERFRSLTSTYYRGAQGVLLVYDITRQATFNNIRQWLMEVDIFATRENIIKVLVGNKIDLEKSRQISRKQGRELAQVHNMLFFEASAKTRLGVSDPFLELVERILDSPSLLEEQVFDEKSAPFDNKNRQQILKKNTKPIKKSFFSSFFMDDRKKSKENEVLLWLKEIQLAQYHKMFLNNSLKDMDSIKRYMNDKTLDKLGITTVSHKSKILKAVNRLILTDILMSNDLCDLTQVLKGNDIDLDIIRNDLKLNEADEFCKVLKFTVEQTELFIKLVKIVHSTVVNIKQVEENKNVELPRNICSNKKANLKTMKMEIILIGDAGVGKTCLIQRYVKNIFNESAHSTVGVDFVRYQETLSDDTIMQMEIWDTAGQETFQSISSTYYKSADAIIVCFDVGRNITYENCANWTEQIEEYGRENVIVIFVGCKGDISADSRKSVEQKARQMMQRFGKLYCECSAKTGENVRNVFFTAAELVMKQRAKMKQEQYNIQGDVECSVSFETSQHTMRNKSDCMISCGYG